MKLFIDMGGTHLRSEIHGLKDVIYQKLPSCDHDLICFIEKCLTDYPDIRFIGISFAGQVYNGEILSAPNITVSKRKIKHHFESRYPLRLEIDNDLNCAVMAEAENLQEGNIAALYIGTGLGSAVVDQGKLIRGYRNQAFELGHIPYKEAPFLCGCKKSNCIELFASGAGLEQWMRYNKKEGYDKKPNLERLKKEGDPLAAVFEKALLHATATLVTLANPVCLVLGGGIIKENPYLVSLIQEKISTVALSSSLAGLNIVQTRLENAAMDGAKLLERGNY